MHAKLMRLALLLLCLGACTIQENVDPVTRKEAVAQAKGFIEAAGLVRPAVDFLGLLPTYECKLEGDAYQAQIVGALKETFPVSCATVESHYANNEGKVRVIMNKPGCQMGDQLLTGEAVLGFIQGARRLNLSVDLSGLEANGVPVSFSVYYGRCEQKHQIIFSGRGVQADRPVQIDLAAELSEKTQQVLRIGKTVVLLDGIIEVSDPSGTHLVTVSRLRYEPGSVLPAGGAISFRTTDGHLIQVSFASSLWRVNQIEVKIDDDEPYNAPIST